MAKSKYIETLEEQYTKKDAKSVLRYKAPDNKWRYVQTSKDASGGNMPSGGGMVEVKWQKLKDKRDNGELNPGSLYRITDYQCTTTQENTQSAGHQFDIVLLALSEDKLAEEGWAMEHSTDVYEVTFSDNVTKKCYFYKIDDSTCNIVDTNTLLGISGVGISEFTEINEETKTALTDNYKSSDLNQSDVYYNYFQNSNLSAWKVWYCLDNDKSRFAWADDSVDEGSPASINDDYFRSSEYDTDGKYAWDSNGDGSGLLYTDKETPEVGDTTYILIKTNFRESGTVYSFTPAQEGTGLPNGRGVIYRLIDEWGNDVGYDFKNIQFLRPMTDGQYDAQGTDTWAYTFNLWYNDSCVDGSIIGNTLLNDEDIVEGVKDNLITETPINWIVDSTLASDKKPCCGLSNNVVLAILEGDWFYGIANINIKGGSSNNTISVGEALAAHINILERSEGNIVERSLVSLIDCIQSTISSESVYCIKALELTVSSPGFYFNEKKVLTEE